MLDYEKLEHKLTNCNMNSLLKDKRIEKYLEEHKKNICPYVLKINNTYKCTSSLHKDIKINFWED